MNSYESCNLSEAEAEGFILEDLSTPYGLAEVVYLGPGGIFVILSESADPASAYDYFRNLLGAARVRLYFVGKGEYLSSDASFSGEIDPEELYAVINEYLYKLPRQYTQSTLERMKDVLIKSDARVKGCYTDENGNTYLFRHGEFRKASEINPEGVFKLCLYGGVLGLHRFALGKWVTGLIYAFTCGLFLLGWLCDLLLLFLGGQKDKHKNLLMPLDSRASKLRVLPIGLIVNLVLFFVWFKIFEIVPILQ